MLESSPLQCSGQTGIRHRASEGLPAAEAGTGFAFSHRHESNHDHTKCVPAGQSLAFEVAVELKLE